MNESLLAAWPAVGRDNSRGRVPRPFFRKARASCHVKVQAHAVSKRFARKYLLRSGLATLSGVNLEAPRAGVGPPGCIAKLMPSLDILESLVVRDVSNLQCLCNSCAKLPVSFVSH